MKAAFSSSLTVSVSKEHAHLKCLLLQPIPNTLAASDSCFISKRIHVPHTRSSYCSEKGPLPLKKQALSIRLSLDVRPLCAPIPPEDDSSSKGKSSSSTNAIDKSVPKIPFWTAAIAEIAIGVLGIILCTVSNIPALGPNFSLSPSAVLHACQISMIFSGAFWIVDKLPVGIGKQTDAQFRVYFEDRNILDVEIFCICVAFGEELFFRAWLLNAICNIGFSKPFALTTSAVVFGMLHAYDAVYVMLASLAGVVFGLMLLSTESILEPLLVHFVYDFGVIVMLQQRWHAQDSVAEK